MVSAKSLFVALVGTALGEDAAEYSALVALKDNKYDSSKPEEEGKRFMEDVVKEPGVQKLSSGLMYKVLKTGKGPAHPTADTPCDCHYRGQLIDGSEFDSSYARGEPTSFAPNQVIRGWTEAMQLMVEGDKWEMYIPADLAYGASGSPPKIPGNSVLVFTMEIIKVKGPGVPAQRCDVVSLEQCDDKEKTYIEKQNKKDEAGQKKEFARLEKMLNEAKSNIKPETKIWLQTRRNLLAKITKHEL